MKKSPGLAHFLNKSFLIFKARNVGDKKYQMQILKLFQYSKKYSALKWTIGIHNFIMFKASTVIAYRWSGTIHCMHRVQHLKIGKILPRKKWIVSNAYGLSYLLGIYNSNFIHLKRLTMSEPKRLITAVLLSTAQHYLLIFGYR